jgi:hypothetical protein
MEYRGGSTRFKADGTDLVLAHLNKAASVDPGVDMGRVT